MVSFGPTHRFEPIRIGDSARVTGWRVCVKPPTFLVGDLPEQHVDLTLDQFERFLKWQNGDGMIQNMLPDLTASQREILISGLGDKDFERFTKPQDDD